MREINALVERYQAHARFAFVYILEAHAVDEWPVRCTNADLPQHKCLADRATAADRLRRDYPLHPQLHLLLDNEHDDFQHTYPSWPFRYWVLHHPAAGPTVALKMAPDADLASLEPLQDWCARHLPN